MYHVGHCLLYQTLVWLDKADYVAGHRIIVDKFQTNITFTHTFSRRYTSPLWSRLENTHQPILVVRDDFMDEVVRLGGFGDGEVDRCSQCQALNLLVLTRLFTSYRHTTGML